MKIEWSERLGEAYYSPEATIASKLMLETKSRDNIVVK